MNARMHELYLQAHLVREYPLDDPMHGGNPPTNYWGGEVSAKKFAELLVKECATLVDTSWDLSGNMIREHFGIEK